VAGDEVHFGFTTDVDRVVSDIGQGMGRLESIMEAAGGRLGDLDLGRSVLENFRADLERMGQLAERETAKIRGTLERSIVKATSTSPFQQPAGGSYASQANAANRGLVTNVNDVVRGYVDALPEQLRSELGPAIEAEGRRYTAERLSVLRQINEADIASLRKVSEYARGHGGTIPLRQAIVGSGLSDVNLESREFRGFGRVPASVNQQAAQLEEQARIAASAAKFNPASNIGGLAGGYDSRADVKARMQGLVAQYEADAQRAARPSDAPFRRRASDLEPDPDDPDVTRPRYSQGRMQAAAQAENTRRDAKKQDDDQRQGVLEERAARMDLERAEKKQADAQRAGTLEMRAAAEDLARAEKAQDDAQRKGTLEMRAAREDVARAEKAQDDAQRRGVLEERAARMDLERAEKAQADAQRKGTLEMRAAAEDVARAEKAQDDAQRQGVLEERAARMDLERAEKKQADAQRQGTLEMRAAAEDVARAEKAQDDAQRQGLLEERAARMDLERAEKKQADAQRQGLLEERAAREDVARAEKAQDDAQRQGLLEERAARMDVERADKKQADAQRQGLLEERAARMDVERAEAAQDRAQRQGVMQERAARLDLERSEKAQADAQRQGRMEGQAGREDEQRFNRASINTGLRDGSVNEYRPGQYRDNNTGTFYRSSLAGQGATEVTGEAVATAERDYASVMQAAAQRRGVTESRAYRADEELTNASQRRAQAMGNFELRAYRLDEQILQAEQELANATKIAAEYMAGTAKRSGSFYQLGNGELYKETAAGARTVDSPLEQIQARDAIARSQRAAARTVGPNEEPPGFFKSFGTALTSRNAYGSGPAGGLDLSRVPSNLGSRLGSVVESFAGFAALGGAIKLLSDTKKETLDYIDSLTNLEVRMQRTGSVTAEFTNQLEGLSRLAGSNVGAELDAAARSVAAFGDKSKDSTEQLRQIGAAGATAASQLSVITGTDLQSSIDNTIAIASSFGVASDGLSQVNDAIANAKQLGGNANDIASGLAGIAGAAQEAGFNMQQAADVISLVTARTNESGTAAATRITALFSLLGSHQSTLQSLGVNTTQSTADQINQLAGVFPKLSSEQQKATLSALGGRTALRELIPLLTDNTQLQKAYSDSLDHAGAGTDEFNRKNNDLAGLFRKIGGDITNIQINLERSGIFDAIGLSLKLLEPGLRTLGDILGLVDRFVDTLDNLHLGPLGEVPGTLLDIWLALKLIDSVRPITGVLSKIPGIGGTRGLPEAITKKVPALAQGGAAAADAAANGADTTAINANTQATAANTAAKAANADATVTEATASTADAATRAADQQAILAEITALAALGDLQTASAQLELRAAEARELATKAAYDEIAALSEAAEFEGLLARVTTEGIGPITAQIAAERAHMDTLNATILLEGRQIEQLELLAAARARDAEAAAADNAEQAAGAGGAGLLGLGGLAAGLRGRLAARNAAKSTAATEGEEAAAGAGGLGLLGKAGIAFAVYSLVIDPLFHSIRDAASKTQKSLQDTATAIGDVGTAASPDQMHKAADALRTAASEAAASTSGKVGATLGAINKFADGSDANADAESLRAAAKREDARAAALDKAEREAAANGSGAVFGNAPNTIDGIKAGFDKMSAAGESASHQIDSLVEALGGLDGKNTGPGTLLPGQGPVLGQALAATAQGNQEVSLVDLLNQKGGDAASNRQTVKSLIEGGKFGVTTLGGIDPQLQQDTQDAITKQVTDYLSAHGLSNGGHLSDAQQKELSDLIAQIEIKALGLTGKAYDDARATAAAKVLAQLRSGTNPGDLIVDQDTADYIAGQLVSKADAAGQSTKLNTGSDVAAAREKLAKIEEAEALVLKKGQKVNDDTKDAELKAKQDLADALSAQADAYESLTKDELGADDAVGRSRQDVATAARHLAEAEKSKDPNKIAKAKQDKIDADRAAQLVQQQSYQAYLAGQENPNDHTETDQKTLEIERNKLKHTDEYGSDGKLTTAYRTQLKTVQEARDKVLQDQLDDANATAADSVDSRDAVGNAQKALDAAKATLTSLRSRRAGPRELSDAKKAVADATVALTQAQITDQNDTRDAAVDAGDTVGQAYAAYLDLVNSEGGAIGSALAGLKRQAAEAYSKYLKAKADAEHTRRLAKINPADAIKINAEDIRYDDVLLAIKGQSTEDLAGERAQKVTDLVTRAQLRVALDNAKRDASIRQGDPVSAASAALSDARGNLSLDKIKNDKYYQDLAAVRAAEYSLAQANEEHAKTLLTLSSDTTDPVAQARVALAAANKKLRDDQSKRTGDLAQDKLDKETAAQALQKAQFDQNLQNQQNAYQLHEESADQYLTFLKSQDSSIRKQLAGMKKGQEGYQQLVDELNTIDQAIQGLNDQLEGQFNLGSIKLPTVYEVRRSEAQGSTAASASVANSVVTNNVTINGADMQTVINYLSSVLGKSSMTVATSGRKAT
jgi:hypothetical protein